MSAKIVPTRTRATNASFRAAREGRRDLPNPFATILHDTSLSTIITDPSGVDNPIVFANPAFCRMTGYRLAEVLGRNCRFLQGPDTDAATVAQIGAALRAKQSIEIDIRNYRKNGSPFWNRLLIGPVYTEAGSLAYFFGSQIDVTTERDPTGETVLAALEERKRVRAALDHLHAVEAVCHLAGGIAHSFDNLLGGIRGSLEMLQRDIAIPVGERSARARSVRKKSDREAPIRVRSASLY